MFYTADYFA